MNTNHFTSRVVARYDRRPVDWRRLDDGSWLVATADAIWRTREGQPNVLVTRFPELVRYANSLVMTSDGTFYVGMCGGVLRLTPTWPGMPRYAADFLWKASTDNHGCQPRGNTH